MKQLPVYVQSLGKGREAKLGKKLRHLERLPQFKQLKLSEIATVEGAEVVKLQQQHTDPAVEGSKK